MATKEHPSFAAISLRRTGKRAQKPGLTTDLKPRNTRNTRKGKGFEQEETETTGSRMTTWERLTGSAIPLDKAGRAGELNSCGKKACKRAELG